jgi:hypothetical protein
MPAGARISSPGPGPTKPFPNTAKGPRDRSVNDEGGGQDMRDATQGREEGSPPGSGPASPAGGDKAIDPNDPDAPRPHQPKLPKK